MFIHMVKISLFIEPEQLRQSLHLSLVQAVKTQSDEAITLDGGRQAARGVNDAQIEHAEGACLEAKLLNQITKLLVCLHLSETQLQLWRNAPSFLSPVCPSISFASPHLTSLVKCFLSN
jgi:hypothetical protein